MPTLVIIAYMIGYMPITFGQATLVETITRHRRRVSKKILAIAYAACYILQAAVYFLMPGNVPGAMFINAFFTIAPLMAISVFLYRGTVFTTLFAGASTMLGALGEALAAYLVSVFSGVPISEMINTPSLVAVAMFVSGLLTSSVLFLAAFICRQVQKNSGYLSGTYLTAILLTIASSAAIAYSIMHTVLSDKAMNEVLAIFIVLVLVGINFIILFLYRRMVRDTENRYRNLFADTPAGVCVLNPDERLTIALANKVFYKIMGVKPNSLPKGRKAKNTDESFLDLLGEDARENVKKQWAEMQCGTGTNFEYEVPVTLPDGSKRSILASIFYDREKTKRITVNVLDITRRKQMEQELRLLEQEYRIAVEMTNRHVVLYNIKEKTARQLPGLNNQLHFPSELTNFPQELIDSGILDETSRDSYDEFFGAIWRGEKSGSAYLRMHTTDSMEFRWYRAEFATAYGVDGAPTHATIAVSDAQEQHENELAYKRLRQSASEIPVAEYKLYERNLTQNTVESESGEAFSSPASVLSGCKPEDIPALVNAHVYPEYEESLISFVSRDRLLSAYKHGLTSDQMEIRVITGDGKSLWFSAHIQLVEDSFSGDIKAYYLFRNIDEQKKHELKVMLDMDELKTQLENSRIRIMMNQMQPHFLYNALSAIQTIIKVDPDYAYRLVGDFTVHLRSSIKALQNDDPIPFREELKNIKAYLNIEKMRMGEKLTFEYDIQSEDFMVIPLTIQPLAENAARHGIYPQAEKGGTITVRSYETETAYMVEVRDNGAGFDVNEVLNRPSDSVGLKNLIFRLRKLMNADVDIQSKPGCGTRAVVTIPKKEAQAHNKLPGIHNESI